jgi:dTDP-4-dehydrorhamnose 3,5-epimerase
VDRRRSEPRSLIEKATERQPSVTPEGERLESLIHEVSVRPAKTQTDARGTLTEIYDPGWGFTHEPMVYAYMVTIRPGVTKGWIVHRRHLDRLFFAFGSIRVVLYDDRGGSPTRGMLNELFFDEYNRGLLRIPTGVWHAVSNVGLTESIMINHPTEPYDHHDPDKWDLPLDTPEIPYEF